MLYISIVCETRTKKKTQSKLNNFCNILCFCCCSICIPKRIRVVYEVTVNHKLRCQHVTASMELFATPAKRILYIRMNRHN